MLDITDERARENHLYDHPEDVTPEDVRAMVSNLRAMRECAMIIEQRGGGSAAVATMELNGNGSMTVRLTAPACGPNTLRELLGTAVRALVTSEVFGDGSGEE